MYHPPKVALYITETKSHHEARLRGDTKTKNEMTGKSGSHISLKNSCNKTELSFKVCYYNVFNPAVVTQ